MKHKLAFLLLNLFFLLVSNANAQHENIWVFGTRAGINFNSGDPVSIRSEMQGFGEANASVCDKNGQLLFYTDGSYVWNQDHVIMKNGSNLTPFITSGVSPTSSTSQGAIIIPMPGNDQKYYIFSLTSSEQEDNAGRLYYSVVDRKDDNGLGGVVPHQKGILLDSNLLEKMTGVVGDNCNIWLIVCDKKHSFRAYEITGSGIHPNPVVSKIDQMNIDIVGCLTVSPDRKKIAATATPPNQTALFFNGAMLCDFDVQSGIVSNPLQLLPSAGGYGVSFSPDNTKLYINTINTTSTQIYQFDLSSGDSSTILSSKTYMGAGAFTHLKLASDNKIYFNPGYAGSYLGTIKSPNLPGAAAGYTPRALTLLSGTTMSAGLPNVVPIINQDTVTHVKYDTMDCFVGEVLLKAENQSGSNYSWNDSTYGTQKLIRASGTYWVKYHMPPCIVHVDSFFIRLPTGTLPELNTSTSCRGKNNAMAWFNEAQGDTTSYTYTWRDQDNRILSNSDTLRNVAPGKYTVHISTSSGCDTTLIVNLEESDVRVTFHADSINCLIDAVTFENTSDNYFTSFKWFFDDGNISDLKNPIHNYKTAGSYNVMLVGTGKSCADTASKTIIIDAPIVNVFRGDRDSICTGESVNFIATSDSTVLYLNWQFGDGNNYHTADANTSHAFDKEGLMSIQLRSDFRACPSTSFEDTIYVFPLPKVSLGTDSVLCLNSEPLLLYNIFSQNSDNYNNEWSTGETTDTITIRQVGSYSLRVTSMFGCISNETVKISKSCYVDIPNAFTPNDDGINDYFFPRQLMSKKLTHFHMRIFNRWGQVVFETQEVESRGWDGKFNNVEQPAGIYIYVIEAGMNKQKTERYEGNITLMR